jgi:hypothetical protein
MESVPQAFFCRSLFLAIPSTTSHPPLSMAGVRAIESMAAYYDVIAIKGSLVVVDFSATW